MIYYVHSMSYDALNIIQRLDMNDRSGSVLVTFRATKAVADAAEAAAAKEGLSRAALARRALLRDLAGQDGTLRERTTADNSPRRRRAESDGRCLTAYDTVDEGQLNS
jgi:hypothetical protein